MSNEIYLSDLHRNCMLLAFLAHDFMALPVVDLPS